MFRMIGCKETRMNRRSSKLLRAIGLVLVPLAFACQPDMLPVMAQPSQTQVSDPADPRVIIFVIDGPRYTEFFGDPTHQHIPHIWNELRPLGTLCSNFRNLTRTETMSGHTSILTGVWQTIANDGSERANAPTLFEYYRKATGAAPQDAVIISSKAKLAACTYGLDPGYGPAYAAQADVGLATDYDTYDHLIQRLNVDKPHLVMASFSEVDVKAHSGVWADYVRQIEIVDSLAVLTWNHLQNDPDYAGQTYMFITADHGRHDDAHGGFQNHGDDCDGCRHLIFLALGPGIRAGYEVGTLYTQRDVCNTAGAVLGIATPLAEGFTIGEIFEPVSTGILH
jgi:hypothetical protein